MTDDGLAHKPEVYECMLSRRDILGHRLTMGVIAPSINTTVQPDFDNVRPFGVTNHYSRIAVDDPSAISNETFQEGAQAISDNTLDAVKSILSCKSDFLAMGMSAVTFWGGKQGAESFRKGIEDALGLRLSCGPESLIAAFDAYKVQGFGRLLAEF